MCWAARSSSPTSSRTSSASPRSTTGSTKSSTPRRRPKTLCTPIRATVVEKATLMTTPGRRRRSPATRRCANLEQPDPWSRARRGSTSLNRPKSDASISMPPSGRSRAPRTDPSASRMEAIVRSSPVRRTKRLGRSVISRRMAPKSPEAACRPATTTSIWRATCSTSSRMWELNSTVRPSAPIVRSSSIRCTRCRGSMPLKGSSSSSTVGSWTSEAATLIRCRIPLEYVRDGRSARRSSRPCRSTPRGRAGLARRCSFAFATTNSRPVRKSSTASRSRTMPSPR